MADARAARRSPHTFEAALQSISSLHDRPPRRFGGWRTSIRCERFRHNLLFLIADDQRHGEDSLPELVRKIARDFDLWVRVDHIEKRQACGRDVYAIHETAFQRSDRSIAD